MEAFTLLKYWRGGAGALVNRAKNDSTTTTIVTDNRQTLAGDDDVDADEGPFFDLEFAVNPDEEEEEENDENGSDSENGDDSDEDDDNGFNFTLSSGSSHEEEDADDRTDQNLVLSPPSDGGDDDGGNNLFFKGKLLPIEDLEANSKPQFPVSFLKSATKLRVFMLGFKKSKPNNTTKKEANNKLFTVKFKVEEVKPIASLFTRDTSSRNNPKLSLKQSIDSTLPTTEVDDKRFSKEIMQKYLKKVKPLYVRVSKRYGDKAKSAPPPADNGEEKTPAKPAAVKQEGSFPAGLRVVCKHLGKSRSASSAAVAAAPSPGAVAPSRRDDSLLQQQDGIQSAILHCKRSFNASRESDSSLLSRSVSDPSYEKSIDLSRKSSSEKK